MLEHTHKQAPIVPITYIHDCSNKLTSIALINKKVNFIYAHRHIATHTHARIVIINTRI